MKLDPDDLLKSIPPQARRAFTAALVMALGDRRQLCLDRAAGMRLLKRPELDVVASVLEMLAESDQRAGQALKERL